jgi:hypothetical protein
MYRPGGGQPYLRAMDDRFQPGVPPTDDFGGPLRKGVPYATAEARPFSSCSTSSTLQHHSPGGCPSDCDLQLHCRLAQVDSWLGQFGTRHDDDDARPLP